MRSVCDDELSPALDLARQQQLLHGDGHGCNGELSIASDHGNNCSSSELSTLAGQSREHMGRARPACNAAGRSANLLCRAAVSGWVAWAAGRNGVRQPDVRNHNIVPLTQAPPDSKSSPHAKPTSHFT